MQSSKYPCIKIFALLVFYATVTSGLIFVYDIFGYGPYEVTEVHSQRETGKTDARAVAERRALEEDHQRLLDSVRARDYAEQRDYAKRLNAFEEAWKSKINSQQISQEGRQENLNSLLSALKKTDEEIRETNKSLEFSSAQKPDREDAIARLETIQENLISYVYSTLKKLSGYENFNASTTLQNIRSIYKSRINRYAEGLKEAIKENDQGAIEKNKNALEQIKADLISYSKYEKFATAQDIESSEILKKPLEEALRFHEERKPFIDLIGHLGELSIKRNITVVENDLEQIAKNRASLSAKDIEAFEKAFAKARDSYAISEKDMGNMSKLNVDFHLLCIERNLDGDKPSVLKNVLDAIEEHASKKDVLYLTDMLDRLDGLKNRSAQARLAQLKNVLIETLILRLGNGKKIDERIIDFLSKRFDKLSSEQKKFVSKFTPQLIKNFLKFESRPKELLSLIEELSVFVSNKEANKEIQAILQELQQHVTIPVQLQSVSLLMIDSGLSLGVSDAVKKGEVILSAIFNSAIKNVSAESLKTASDLITESGDLFKHKEMQDIIKEKQTELLLAIIESGFEGSEEFVVKKLGELVEKGHITLEDNTRVTIALALHNKDLTLEEKVTILNNLLAEDPNSFEIVVDAINNLKALPGSEGFKDKVKKDQYIDQQMLELFKTAGKNFDQLRPEQKELLKKQIVEFIKKHSAIINNEEIVLFLHDFLAKVPSLTKDLAAELIKLIDIKKIQEQKKDQDIGINIKFLEILDAAQEKLDPKDYFDKKLNSIKEILEHSQSDLSQEVLEKLTRHISGIALLAAKNQDVADVLAILLSARSLIKSDQTKTVDLLLLSLLEKVSRSLSKDLLKDSQANAIANALLALWKQNPKAGFNLITSAILPRIEKTAHKETVDEIRTYMSEAAKKYKPLSEDTPQSEEQSKPQVVVSEQPQKPSQPVPAQPEKTVLQILIDEMDQTKILTESQKQELLKVSSEQFIVQKLIDFARQDENPIVWLDGLVEKLTGKETTKKLIVDLTARQLRLLDAFKADDYQKMSPEKINKLQKVVTNIETRMKILKDVFAADGNGFNTAISILGKVHEMKKMRREELGLWQWAVPILRLLRFFDWEKVVNNDNRANTIETLTKIQADLQADSQKIKEENLNEQIVVALVIIKDILASAVKPEKA